MTEVTINKDARLSEHFTLGEMCKTSAKTVDGNIPSHVHIENLKRVCGWLEELRKRLSSDPSRHLLAPLRSQAIGQSTQDKYHKGVSYFSSLHLGGSTPSR